MLDGFLSIPSQVLNDLVLVRNKTSHGSIAKLVHHIGEIADSGSSLYKSMLKASAELAWLGNLPEDRSYQLANWLYDRHVELNKSGNTGALADWVGKVGFEEAVPHVAKNMGVSEERAKKVVGKLKGMAKERGSLKAEHSYDPKVRKQAKKRKKSMTKSASGEGSRGGKVIGHTKSGKPVYDKALHPAHKDFDINDHFDAANVHAKLYNEHRKYAQGVLSSMSHEEASDPKSGKYKAHEEAFKKQRYHRDEAVKHEGSMRQLQQGYQDKKRDKHHDPAHGVYAPGTYPKDGSLRGLKKSKN